MEHYNEWGGSEGHSIGGSGGGDGDSGGYSLRDRQCWSRGST